MNKHYLKALIAIGLLVLFLGSTKAEAAPCLVPGGCTGQASFPVGGFLFQGTDPLRLAATSSPTVGWLTATSTTATTSLKKTSITGAVSILGEYFTNFTSYVRSLFTAGTGLTVTSGQFSLANTAVTPGSYTNTNLTVDQQGRITAASSGTGGSGTGVATTSLLATYPVQVNKSLASIIYSLAFGTTTPNVWSGLQRFNGGATTTALTVSGPTWLGITGMTQCLRVNSLGLVSGTGADCGAGGGGSGSVSTSTPTGTVDGVNQDFTTANLPLVFYVNGVAQSAGTDYTTTGSGPYTNTFVTPPAENSVLLYTYNSVSSAVLPLSVSNGGTGITTYTAGDMLYSSATNVLSRLGIGTNGKVLAIVNGLPAWVATTTFSGGLTYSDGIVTNTLTAGDGLTRTVDDIDCDTASGSVFGCLSSADWTTFNGKENVLTFGDGLTRTANDVDVDTTQNITTLSNLTGNGFVKTSGGTGALSIDTNTYLTGNQSITLSGDISGTGTTAITTVIGALKVVGSMIANATIDLATKVTGILPVANGGTGVNTFTASRLLYGNGTGPLSSVATSSISVGAGLTNTGTLGAQVGGSALTLKQVENRSFSYATTTAWTGTTTIPLGIGYGEAWNTAKCFTNTGTLKVDFYHGSTHYPLVAVTSSVGSVSLGGGTNTVDDKTFADIGTPASSPTKITCTVNNTI